MDRDIDMDSLITLVENRPIVWGKTADSYKKKQLKFAAWKEICTMLHEHFETLSDKLVSLHYLLKYTYILNICIAVKLPLTEFEKGISRRLELEQGGDESTTMLLITPSSL